MSAVVSQPEWGPLTPENIRSQRFMPVGHGYDRSDVRGFLFQLAEVVAHLERQVEALRADPPPMTYEQIATETRSIVESAHQAAVETRRAARAQAHEELALAARQAARAVEDAHRRRRATAHVVRLLEEHRDAVARDLHRMHTELETAVADLGPPPPVPPPTLF